MIINLCNIHHSYTQGNETLQILKGINLKLNAGEIIALVGASGTGKSTLLHIAGLLESPTQGEIFINNQAVHHLSDKQKTQLRGHSIGFVYQFHHLLPEFTALENVMMPLLIQGISENEAKKQASQLLERMGLSHRLSHRPQKLSGGEQQRVSIARALVAKPSLLLADEPTGNLDDETSEQVFQELLDHIKNQGMAAIIATHDLQLASKMDRIVRLHHGLIENEEHS